MARKNAGNGVMASGASLDLEDLKERRDSPEAKERFRHLIERIYDLYVGRAGGSDHGVKAQLGRDFNVSQPTVSNWLGQGPKTESGEGLFKMTDSIENYMKIAEILGFSVENIFYHIFYGKPLGELPGEVRNADRLSQVQALLLLMQQEGGTIDLLSASEIAIRMVKGEMSGDIIPDAMPLTYFEMFRRFRDTEFGGQDSAFVKLLTGRKTGIHDDYSGISFIGREDAAIGLLTGEYYPNQEEMEALCSWMHDISDNDEFSCENVFANPDRVNGNGEKELSSN